MLLFKVLSAPYKNQCFDSFAQCEEFLNNYWNEKCEMFSKVKAEWNDDKTNYKRLNFKCIHYRDENCIKSKGTGDRPNQAYYANCCPAYLNLSYRTCGKNKNKYVISKLNLNHNHEHIILNREFFKLHPRNRLLSEEQLVEVKDMIKTKSKPALILNHLQEKYDIKLVSKDIYNINQKLFTEDNEFNKFPKEKRDLAMLQSIINQQIEKDGGDYFKYIKNEENQDLYAIYYQNPQMKEFYRRYSNMLFVDSTYNLNDVKYPALVLVVQDEDGQSYPVCVIILAYERKSLFDECFGMFVEENKEYADKTEAIMIDKDLKEDDMLSKHFPKAQILYCVWHVIKTFKKNFAKNSSELSLLTEMIYSVTLEKYNELVSKFKSVASTIGLKYFVENWENCTTKWVKYHRIGLNIRNNNKKTPLRA